VIGLQDSCCCPELRAAVLHNPCSQEPVDSSIFGEWPQFGAMNSKIRSYRLNGDCANEAILEETLD
jgi:hypothetical protein